MNNNYEYVSRFNEIAKDYWGMIPSEEPVTPFATWLSTSDPKARQEADDFHLKCIIRHEPNHLEGFDWYIDVWNGEESDKFVKNLTVGQMVAWAHDYICFTLGKGSDYNPTFEEIEDVIKNKML